MNTIRKIFVILTVAALGLLVVPTFAADTKTVTITEATINATYRVTNPARRSVSSKSVDLQPGKVVVSYSVTYPKKPTVQVIKTFVPSIQNGRVYWSVTSVTRNGSEISADLLKQINTEIETSWINYFKQKAGTGHVSAIEITDTAINLTLTK
jgi:hypothetical protein